jgi:predicted dehydrogenase
VGKRLADAVVIAVQDYMHAEVTVAFAEQGYHILCEKPMATCLDDCLKMEMAVKKAQIIFGMGHGMNSADTFSYRLTLPAVMRYSPYSQEITDIVRSGSLGRLINVVQVEPVGYYHFAHSFVRGNWNKEKNSSFALMTKCCQ